MDIILIKDIVIVFLTCIAILISVATFIRQRTFDNENHFFKYKLEKYNSILSECYKITSYHRDVIEVVRKAIKSKTITEQQSDAIADKVDSRTNLFQDKVLVDAAFLPESIVSKINEILDQLFGDDLIIDTDNQQVQKMLKLLDKVEISIDDLSELMRQDLGIDVLHKRLEKRTKS